jgi:hypothetical protein
MMQNSRAAGQNEIHPGFEAPPRLIAPVDLASYTQTHLTACELCEIRNQTTQKGTLYFICLNPNLVNGEETIP